MSFSAALNKSGAPSPAPPLNTDMAATLPSHVRHPRPLHSFPRTYWSRNRKIRCREGHIQRTQPHPCLRVTTPIQLPSHPQPEWCPLHVLTQKVDDSALWIFLHATEERQAVTVHVENASRIQPGQKHLDGLLLVSLMEPSEAEGDSSSKEQTSEQPPKGDDSNPVETVPKENNSNSNPPGGGSGGLGDDGSGGNDDREKCVSASSNKKDKKKDEGDNEGNNGGDNEGGNEEEQQDPPHENPTRAAAPANNGQTGPSNDQTGIQAMTRQAQAMTRQVQAMVREVQAVVREV